MPGQTKMFLPFILLSAFLAGCGILSLGPAPTPTPTLTPLPPTATPTATANPDAVKVTYVGNSGFLITVGEKKVLVDALFTGFPPDYTLPAQVRDLLAKALPPFDHIDLILATHNHADHFDAALVRLHLQNDPQTVFISTSQAVKQLPDFAARAIAADPRTGTPVNTRANGIQVEAIYLNHGSPPNDPNEIFNNAYLVTIGKVKFFHTGDVGDLQDVRPYRLPEQKIDLGFVQHFYFRQAGTRSQLEALVGAKYWFPIHYHFTTPEFNAGLIRSSFPDAILFSKELDGWEMPPAGN
jgi:L-ascorbate metabolism protein UlaG (beta-lactamase superfamily)